MTEQTLSAPYSDARAFLKGLPWVVMIPFVAFVSWIFWKYALAIWIPEKEVGLASIGVSTMGAYLICLIALAGNWPVAGIAGKWARGIAMIVISQIGAALFFIILSAFSVSLTDWAFPIIATSWFVLSVTSFVGGDFHFQYLPPVRRMFLNLLISVGFTILLMRTIVIFPALWFPFLQVTIITGGLGYLFRRVTQPAFSVLVWALLMTLMFVFLAIADGFGYYTLFGPPTQFWNWNIGSATPQFNVFFAFMCGLNLGVLACIQCWPFSRIRQPWGTCVATLCLIGWCLAMTSVAIAVFSGLYPDGDYMSEAMVMAWHTVFWGFAWVYCFGVGQTPYLWAGQKTPGTWDDVD